MKPRDQHRSGPLASSVSEVSSVSAASSAKSPLPPLPPLPPLSKLSKLSMLSALLVAAAPAALAAPADGRYEAELCVTTAAASRNCGPAALQLRRGGARVQVSDIVYWLRFGERGHAEVRMTQGAMQLDGFSSDYEWDADTLRFVDLEKRLLYEVQVGARQDAGR